MLFLTPGCFDKGGVSRYSRYQMRALSELFGEQNVRTLSLLGPGPDPIEEPVKVHWHANGSTALSKARFAAVTIRQAVFWRPTVIHSAHLNLGDLGLFAGKLCGAETILNVYGAEVWSPIPWFAKRAIPHSTKILSDCHATAEHVSEHGLRRSDDITVIWDCVDMLKFTPGDPDPEALSRYSIPSPREHFNVMTLGRVSQNARYKGYERLIRIIARLSPVFPQLRLVIGGGGDLIPDLARLAAELGISDRVVLAGSIAEGDLPDLYRAASVFSLVTEKGKDIGEGIPLTPLEAMACGAAVVVGDQDGSREAIRDGANGYVVSPFEPDTHAETIARLIRDPELLDRLRKGAVSIARRYFSYETFRDKHEKLYNAIVS